MKAVLKIFLFPILLVSPLAIFLFLATVKIDLGAAVFAFLIVLSCGFIVGATLAFYEIKRCGLLSKKILKGMLFIGYGFISAFCLLVFCAFLFSEPTTKPKYDNSAHYLVKYKSINRKTIIKVTSDKIPQNALTTGDKLNTNKKISDIIMALRVIVFWGIATFLIIELHRGIDSN
jgi:hypothetical protein